MTRLRGWMMAGAIGVVLLAAIGAPAQTYTTLLFFDGTDGAGPMATVTQGLDGDFYGTTTAGPGTAHPSGTIFKITPGGAITTLHAFCSLPNCADGTQPEAPFVLGTDGNFYGVLYAGGAYKHGLVFRVTPLGGFTVLHSFCSQQGCMNGAYPTSLIQADDGNFYGTTASGGDLDFGQACGYPPIACGTVFRLTPTGKFTVLYTLSLALGNSSWPGSLIQGTDGNFYGTTVGQYDFGSVFSITPSGKFTTLHTFTEGPDGADPAGLAEGSNGIFYGVTSGGGPHNLGTVYRITAQGKLSVINGSGYPVKLVQATDGDFYGPFFKITAGGELTTLYTCTASPCFGPSSLIQGTDGSFYGTTFATPGSNNFCTSEDCGSVFRFSVGLSPFVSFVRSSGNIGQTAQILGQGFSGTSAVTFNGTPATFTVESDTYLKATVPDGATTGKLEVTTPTGTLSGNNEFRVLPQITSFTPTSGPPGTTVVITGKSLTQATAVSLACKWPMTFTVDSDTEITATIPADGTTGGIGIQTKGGHVESVGSFTVTQ